MLILVEPRALARSRTQVSPITGQQNGNGPTGCSHQSSDASDATTVSRQATALDWTLKSAPGGYQWAISADPNPQAGGLYTICIWDELRLRAQGLSYLDRRSVQKRRSNESPEPVTWLPERRLPMGWSGSPRTTRRIIAVNNCAPFSALRCDAPGLAARGAPGERRGPNTRRGPRSARSSPETARITARAVFARCGSRFYTTQFGKRQFFPATRPFFS